MCNSKVKVKVLREEWIRGVNLILLFSAFIVRLWIMIPRFLGVYAKKFIHVKVEILKGIHDIIKNGNFNKCHFEKKYKESSLAEFTHSNDFNWFFLHAQHVYSIFYIKIIHHRTLITELYCVQTFWWEVCRRDDKINNVVILV